MTLAKCIVCKTDHGMSNIAIFEKKFYCLPCWNNQKKSYDIQ